MNKTIRAIYEDGVIKPLEQIELMDHTELLVTFETKESKDDGVELYVDPLAGISFSSGIGDLAQNFDEYRFGRKP